MKFYRGRLLQMNLLKLIVMGHGALLIPSLVLELFVGVRIILFWLVNQQPCLISPVLWTLKAWQFNRECSWQKFSDWRKLCLKQIALRLLKYYGLKLHQSTHCRVLGVNHVLKIYSTIRTGN